MRTALFTLSVFSMCFLSGCGPAQYRAEARVYFEKAPQHPNASIDYLSEIADIKSLAKPLIPQGAELKVAKSMIKESENIITIAVTFTDPAKAADICNRIAEAYVAKTKEGVIKTILEKAYEPSKPI
jgi:hypothetical protein